MVMIGDVRDITLCLTFHVKKLCYTTLITKVMFRESLAHSSGTNTNITQPGFEHGITRPNG